MAVTINFPLAKRIGATAFAFRGYNLTNLGRTPELLDHQAYGPIVTRYLDEASALCGEVLGRSVDLASRARNRMETLGLDSYAEDAALIVAVEMAQIRLLEEFFDIQLAKARLAFGYSLGEVAALVATGVYQLSDLLRIPLSLAEDAVALAENVSLGVLFSRGPALDLGLVKRLCLEVSNSGRGTIDMSAYLSPNSVILLGQNGSVDRFQKAMGSVFPDKTFLRKKPQSWPPMHTVITRLRSLPNRAAVLLETTPGGFTPPVLPLLSGVTGKASYNDHNSRELMQHWTDHPQSLWNMVYETLAAGVDTVVHVGPEPNIIPATFKRLSDDVRGQIEGFTPSRLGLKAVSHMVRRPWLAQLLPTSTALLRAPYVRHVILEDWLLEQKLD